MTTSEKPRPLVAGNWKMNGLRSSLTVVEEIAAGYGPSLQRKVELAICPPATLLYACALAAAGSTIELGGQNVHREPSGAFTGDVSAEMLADLGARYVIVGHSERRAQYAESDDAVRQKASAAQRAGLVAIICVGETEAERRAGHALDIVSSQVRGSVPDGMAADDMVIAYEPVWAIGSGLTPTTADVAEMHGRIRAELGARIGPEEGARVRLLYGGSVKPSNAAELMAVANVDGALVGGASLKAADFLGIAGAYAG